MKNFSIVSNVVLFIGLVALYIIHFSSPVAEVEVSEKSDSLNVTKAVVTSGFAYVNMDTLISSYDMAEELSEALQSKQKQMESELNTKSSAYERGVGDFQEKVQKGLVTRAQAQQMEQNLMQEQQSLIQLRDNLTMQLAEEEQVMNRRIVNSIMEYLEIYNQDHNHQFILGRQSLDISVPFADEALNITQNVLTGLNTHYQEQKEQE